MKTEKVLFKATSRAQDYNFTGCMPQMVLLCSPHAIFGELMDRLECCHPELILSTEKALSKHVKKTESEIAMYSTC